MKAKTKYIDVTKDLPPLIIPEALLKKIRSEKKVAKRNRKMP